MSAIFGVYYLDGRPVQPQLLESMSDILKHRGSDRTGIWHDGPIGFGHRMLWTTQESLTETLPKSIRNDALVITADARIDNRDELLSELASSLHSSDRSISDSEIILLAYEKWGDSCPAKLVGDFAFVIWDSRKKRIFCAIDHFGVKCLYYSTSDDRFVFATEIKALFLVDGVSTDLNDLRIADHLRARVDDGEYTFYRDVNRVKPGHSLTVDRSGIQKEAYWQLEPAEELKLKSDHEYAEALLEKFTAAVQARLRTASNGTDVGTMLSGGLDSSSITCMASKLLSETGAPPMRTFSGVFDRVEECDERQYINAVVEGYKIDPHLIIVDKVGPFAELENIFDALDEPAQGNSYISWLCYKAAAEKGVRVILDGFDGDSTISHGLGYFIELARADRFSRLILEIIAYSRHTNSGWRRPVWSWVRNYKIEPWFDRHGTASTARSGFRRFRSKLGGPPKSPNSSIPIKLNREFAAAVRPRIRSRTIDPKPANERELHKAKLTQNGMAQTLECLNRFGGAHGVDIRFPFWDKRLIEFCVRVPVDQKIRSGLSRLIMRNAMKDILPEKIRQRGGKTDMRPGFKYGLGAFGRKYCDDLIIGSDSPLAQYVDMDVLRSYYSRFRNSTAIEKEVLAIQRSVFLGLWLQKTTCR